MGNHPPSPKQISQGMHLRPGSPSRLIPDSVRSPITLGLPTVSGRSNLRSFACQEYSVTQSCRSRGGVPSRGELTMPDTTDFTLWAQAECVSDAVSLGVGLDITRPRARPGEISSSSLPDDGSPLQYSRENLFFLSGTMLSLFFRCSSTCNNQT